MVSDGAAGKAARLRCYALMASGFHDYNPKTKYQKRREEQFQKRGHCAAFRGLYFYYKIMAEDLYCSDLCVPIYLNLHNLCSWQPLLARL